MTKFLKSVLIVLSALLVANFANAGTISADYIKNEVVKAVESDLRAQGFMDVEVKVLAVPFQTLDLPQGRMQMTIVKNQGNMYSKRCIKALKISVDGKLIRSFGVPLEIKAYQNALVATKEIKVGQEISASNSTLKKVEVDGNYTNHLGINALNGEMVASKLYRAGQPIDKRFAKVREDVQKDEFVTVVFDMNNNMSVAIKAKALASGSKGDTIAVQNADNKKVYYGEIIKKNMVKVNI